MNVRLQPSSQGVQASRPAADIPPLLSARSRPLILGSGMRFIFLQDPYRWGKLAYKIRVRLGRALRHKIFAAIEQGADDAAIRLGTRSVLARSRDEWGASPLIAAINAGRPAVVRAFIERGGVRQGDGSLAHAAMRGDLDAIELLLATKKSPDEPLGADDTTHGSYTPLMWAVSRKHVSIVEALLAAGANVDAVASDGSPVVMFAADGEPGSLEALELLCSHKVDISKVDARGRNIIREARDRERLSGKPQMRSILERHYPSIDVNSA
jgi:ankyrin repeat protein